MTPSRSRKSRTSLLVEPLEDRRLLSFAASPTAWDESAWGMADRDDLAPPIRGPFLGSGDFDSASGTDSVDRTWSSNAPETITEVWSGNLEGDQFDRAWSSSAPETITEGWSGNPQENQGGSSAPTFTQPVGGNSGAASSGPGTVHAQDSTGNTLAAATFPVSMATSPFEGMGGLDARTPDQVSPSVQVESITSIEPTTRATPSAPPARLSVSLVPATHVEADPSAHAETAGASTAAAGSPLALLGAIPTDQDFASGNSAHGSSTSGSLVGGPLALSAQARLALDSAFAKSAAGARPPAEGADSPIEEAESTQAQEGQGGVAIPSAGEALERPDPQLADMIMSFMPVDGSTLEGIVDRFLDPLEGLSSSMPGWNSPLGLLTVSLTLAATVLTVDLALRVRRSREEDPDGLGDDDLLHFPGLPGLGRGPIS